jgi:hypothetical protein
MSDTFGPQETKEIVAALLVLSKSIQEANGIDKNKEVDIYRQWEDMLNRLLQ